MCTSDIGSPQAWDNDVLTLRAFALERQARELKAEIEKEVKRNEPR